MSTAQPASRYTLNRDAAHSRRNRFTNAATPYIRQELAANPYRVHHRTRHWQRRQSATTDPRRNVRRTAQPLTRRLRSTLRIRRRNPRSRPTDWRAHRHPRRPARSQIPHRNRRPRYEPSPRTDEKAFPSTPATNLSSPPSASSQPPNAEPFGLQVSTTTSDRAPESSSTRVPSNCASTRSTALKSTAPYAEAVSFSPTKPSPRLATPRPSTTSPTKPSPLSTSPSKPTLTS